MKEFNIERNYQTQGDDYYMQKKKLIGLGVALLATSTLLVACSNNDGEAKVEDTDVVTEVEEEVEKKVDKERATDVDTTQEDEVDEEADNEDSGEEVSEEELDQAPEGEPMGDGENSN